MYHQYVTNQEFIDSPTGMNLTNIVPGGTSAQQSQALTRLLQRSSDIVDRFCYQTLYAEQRTDTFRVWPDNEGSLVIRANKFPVQSVSSFAYQTTPQAGYTSVDLTTVMIDPGVSPILVRAYGNYGWYRSFPKLIVQMTYIAGFVNTTLAQSYSAPTSTLTVVDATGIVAGQVLPIEDSVNSENVTVLSVSGNVITLTAPTVNTHTQGAGVSLIPQVVKEATVLIATFLLNERSNGQVEIGYGTTAPSIGGNMKNSNEYDLALQILQPYRRVV